MDYFATIGWVFFYLFISLLGFLNISIYTPNLMMILISIHTNSIMYKLIQSYWCLRLIVHVWERTCGNFTGMLLLYWSKEKTTRHLFSVVNMFALGKNPNLWKARIKALNHLQSTKTSLKDHKSWVMIYHLGLRIQKYSNIQ